MQEDEKEIKDEMEPSFLRRKWSDGEKWVMGIFSALLIAAIVAIFNMVFSNTDDIIRSITFETLPSNFGIRSKFTGTAQITKRSILVKVDMAIFSLNHQIGREIVDIRVVLAKPENSGWDVIKTSDRMPFGINLNSNETKIQKDIVFQIPLGNIDSVAGHYLVFDISEIALSDKSFGTSHAHTRPDLF